jgi:hypothetical protein
MYTPGQYSDPVLDAIFTDFQNQITTNLAANAASLAGMQTQIKQVTLTLEGELNTMLAAFATLKAYVLANLPS